MTLLTLNDITTNDAAQGGFDAVGITLVDVGGGTSDFSIVRFERADGALKSTPLARSGVGVAGDAFDYRIIDQLVSPASRSKRMIEKSLVPPPKSPTSTVASAASSRAKKNAAPTGS